MISNNTAQCLSKIGIETTATFEDILNRIEELGYDRLAIRRSRIGYRCTLIYHSNRYVSKTFCSQSRKEAMALALLWCIKNTMLDEG